jgi:hypothetical protein
MTRVLLGLLLGLAACGKHTATPEAQQSPAKPVAFPSIAAPQSAMPGKTRAEMKLIPIPKDKTQLAHLISMGYTVHHDHMHPPGVKSCPFDKNGGSLIE